MESGRHRGKIGRGLYNARVTDSNRPEGQRQVIQTCQYKVDCEKAPVYDVRTLVLGHAENIDEVNRLVAGGVLVRDSQGAPRLKTAADNPVSSAPVMVAAPAVDQSATTVLLQIAMEAFKSSRQSPSEAVKDFIGIAQLIQPKTPPVDEIVEAVVARLGGSPRGAAADPFAQYEKVQGFLDRAIGSVFERQGINPAAAAAAVVSGESGSSWAPHIAPIMQEIRAFWPEVLHGLRMLKAEQRAAPQRGTA